MARRSASRSNVYSRNDRHAETYRAGSAAPTQESGVAPIHGTGVPPRHRPRPRPGFRTASPCWYARDAPGTRPQHGRSRHSPRRTIREIRPQATRSPQTVPRTANFRSSPSATRSRSCRQRPGTTSRPRRSSARHPCWFRSSRYIPPGGVAHRKSRFPGFRAVAGRNLCHAPLPQSGRCAPAADTCFARQGHGRTPDRRPRRQRVSRFLNIATTIGMLFMGSWSSNTGIP